MTDVIAVALGTGGCSICTPCSYPDAPRRFPKRALPAKGRTRSLRSLGAPFCGAILRASSGYVRITWFSF